MFEKTNSCKSICKRQKKQSEGWTSKRLPGVVLGLLVVMVVLIWTQRFCEEALSIIWIYICVVGIYIYIYIYIMKITNDKPITNYRLLKAGRTIYGYAKRVETAWRMLMLLKACEIYRSYISKTYFTEPAEGKQNWTKTDWKWETQLCPRSHISNSKLLPDWEANYMQRS